jgi:Arc/MetJ-type ribon-helix-helix transcriptional regulator
MGGGMRKPTKKKAELPPQLKAAAQRDIADGLYANEAEYIKALHPKVREQFNI